jgi:hypothetical protein
MLSISRSATCDQSIRIGMARLDICPNIVKCPVADSTPAALVDSSLELFQFCMVFLIMTAQVPHLVACIGIFAAVNLIAAKCS